MSSSPHPPSSKVGAATAPRTPFNPVQRCFGYTVRPAPLPFYRTLLVEVVRRYTLLNHKDGTPAETKWNGLVLF